MSVYSLASDFTMQTNRSIFITGKAGTGKTTFLHRLRNKTYKKIAIVAPTGVAAINAGGVTIHSFFQLPFGPFIPTAEGKKKLLSKRFMNQKKRNVLRELELLVIDEVSMVRADMLDAVDTILKSARHRYHEPFGGVQVIFIGDLFQLSPVAKEDEWRLLSDFYDGVYFFHSHVLSENPPIYIEFDKIYRQSDIRFIDLLNQVRNDSLTREGLDLLKSRYNPGFSPASDDFHITLTTHNSKAEAINLTELEKLTTKKLTFDAIIKGEFPENSFPTEKLLELKIGARVMFVKNDTENPRRYYNGKIGTITQYDDIKEIIYIQSDDKDEEPIEVLPASWENFRYSTNPDTLEIEEEVIGTFTQYPLRLAWAVTIHKSQGLTFDKAVIDAGASFAPGQVYVALSRCRSLEGITLLSPINIAIIKNDKQVVEFSLQANEKNNLEEMFATSRREYQLELLQNLFDFQPLVISAKVWYKSTNENESAFVEDTLPFISYIITKLIGLETVGNKFNLQLKQLVADNHDNIPQLLSERLSAASDYFGLHIGELINILKESPATTDNYQISKDYDGFIHEIYNSLELKKFMMTEISPHFSIENYFETRKRFILTTFRYSSYSKKSTLTGITTEHAELLSALLQLRNRLSDEQSVPVYMIAPMNAIREMAYYLPRSEKEMLKISGMGKTKVNKYGIHFLELINNYRKIISLESTEFEYSDSKRKEKKGNNKKEKKEKGHSAKESLDLWEKGFTIAEIAKKRGFVEGTIAGHLAKFIERGELDIFELIDKCRIAEAEDIIAAKSEDISVYAALNENFNQIEVKMILLWLKMHKNGDERQ